MAERSFATLLLLCSRYVSLSEKKLDLESVPVFRSSDNGQSSNARPSSVRSNFNFNLEKNSNFRRKIHRSVRIVTSINGNDKAWH